MKKIFAFLMLSLLLQTCKSNSTMTTQQLHTDKDLIARLANELIAVSKIPGISIAVSKNEKIIYANAFGYADVKQQIKMTSSSTLRTASIAKVITATALGKLITDGKLDLDKPIKEYIPYLNKQFTNLTVRQLVGHTAGVPHRPSNKKIKNKHYTSVKETVELFADLKLEFKPDEDYSYSTCGFTLLSAVIEGASGKTYMEYLQEEIFDPLNMKNTYAENINELSAQDVKLYYIKKGKRILDKKIVDGSYKLAGAGFRSTPSDLVKMMNAYSNGLIAPNSVQEMFTTNHLKNGTATQVGIGWRMNYDMFARQPVDHAGNWQGARTVLVYYPQEKLSVSIMVNAQCQLLIEETGQIIAQLFLQQNATSNSAASKFDKKLNITFTSSNGTTENYSGKISLNENGNGLLTIDAADRAFLQSIPIYYLGFGDSYAAVTSYGLLYFKLNIEPTLIGKVYFYQNRNQKSPLEKTPMLVLKE